MRIWLFLLLLSCAPQAQSHWRQELKWEGRWEGSTLVVTLGIPGDLTRAFDDDRDGHLSRREVQSHRAALRRLFVKVQAAGQELRPSLEPAPGSRLVLLYSLPPATSELTLLSQPGSPPCLGRLSTGEHTRAFALAGECNRFQVRSLVGGTSLEQFLVLGVHHVLGSIPHLLFLLALVLGAPSLAGLVQTVTAFTVAHALALGLTGLTGWSLEGRWAESLLAWSILAAAFMNLRGRPWHWPLGLGLGLVHGLAFADALLGLGLEGANRLVSLLGFNLGCEAGQLLLACLLWPGLLGLRRRAPEALKLANGGVILAGAWWLPGW